MKMKLPPCCRLERDRPATVDQKGLAFCGGEKLKQGEALEEPHLAKIAGAKQEEARERQEQGKEIGGKTIIILHTKLTTPYYGELASAR
jgi:hypothetical protein